jgi:hypothetical protein
MAITSYVSSYRVQVLPGSGSQRSAFIDCDTPDGHLIGITFYPDNMAMPSNITELLYPDYPEFANIFYASVNMRHDRFVWVVDLLRNEESYVYISPEDPARNTLMSDWTTSSWGHIQ